MQMKMFGTRRGALRLIDLIIHITSDHPETLRDILNEHRLFKKHYDGWEMNIGGRSTTCTSYYYYSINRTNLDTMLEFLHVDHQQKNIPTQSHCYLFPPEIHAPHNIPIPGDERQSDRCTPHE